LRNEAPPVKKGRNHTVQEAAELTGRSVNALRKRMDRGRLGCVYVTTGGTRRRLIPLEALMAAGLLEPQQTRYEREAHRLIRYLSQRRGMPLTTSKLAIESSLLRQQVEAAMGALLALGDVRKSHEPPPIGTGRPRVVWRWISRRQAA
jgi:hypothetical protein